jgi:hypothetical protein
LGLGGLSLRLPPAIMGLYTYVNPVVATVAAWMWLGERVTIRFWLASSAVLGSVALVRSAAGAGRASAEPGVTEGTMPPPEPSTTTAVNYPATTPEDPGRGLRFGCAKYIRNQALRAGVLKSPAGMLLVTEAAACRPCFRQPGPRDQPRVAADARLSWEPPSFGGNHGPLHLGSNSGVQAHCIR